MNIQKVQSSVGNLTQFLTPFLDFVNCHMVEYLTDNLWERFIPQSIQHELLRDPKTSFEILYNHNTHVTFEYEALYEFLHNIDNALNSSIAVNLNDCIENISFSEFKHFMSEKKLHEVNIMAAVCSKLARNVGIEYLIDIGDGKGYLSSHLNLEYRLNILGIDASPINTQSSQKRLNKLKKCWSGLTKTTVNNSNSEYKQITSFVTQETNLNQLMSDSFGAPGEEYGLVGLHTCGNLASNILRLYAKNENLKFVCNVGCCYHLLTEDGREIGFPLSSYLRSQGFTIGRNARMLASQSWERAIENYRQHQHTNNKSLFYRALFQVYLKRKFNTIPPGQVGRKCSNIQDFNEYVERALKTYHLNMEINHTELNDLLVEFAHLEINLSLFYAIRMRFARVIELLILTDRLLYLLEEGYTNTFLVKLFEPVVSPRHFAVISVK